MVAAQPLIYGGRHWKGLRVGLFGGTFNPPHEGHLHAAQRALQILNLDFVWWMVTPGNPLKKDYTPLQKRLEASRDIVGTNPKIIVTDIERHLGTRRTLDTVFALEKRFSQTDFIFVGGTDLALQMHHWHRWQDLVARIPFAFVGRPPASSLIRDIPLRNRTDIRHICLPHGGAWPLEPKTCYWILNTAMKDISSTFLRNTSQMR